MDNVLENTGILKSSLCDTYVIYVDNELKGYTDKEVNAKFFIYEISNKLEEELIEKYGGKDYVNVLRNSNSDNIELFHQTIGTVMNGAVTKVHHIEYKTVSQLVL